MTYAPDAELVTAPAASPERGLACAVLHLAITDALSSTSPHRDRARGWLLEADAAFTFWCTLANINPEAIRDRVRRKCGGLHQASLL